MQKAMNESLSVAEQSWELRSGGIGETEDKTWIVSGAHGLVIEFRNLMMNAQVSMNISDSSIDWISSKDIHNLNLLIRKGISVKVLSTQQSRNTLEKLNLIGAETWVIDRPELCFYVIDDEIVIMKLNKPDVASIVKDKSIAKLFITKLDEMLKSSKSIKSEKIGS